MTEDLHSLHIELERAQCEISRMNSFLPPFIDVPWTPVSRVKATEKEVDNLVEEAESELDGGSSKTVTKTEKSKTKVTKSKRGEKLENAIHIFKKMRGKSRKEVVAVYVSTLGMSKAMASTYYQMIKGKA